MSRRKIPRKCRARFAHCLVPDREAGSVCPCAVKSGDKVISCGRPGFRCTSCSKFRAAEAAKRAGVWSGQVNP